MRQRLAAPLLASLIAATAALAATPRLAAQAELLPVPNGGFESIDPANGFATGWVRGVSEGTQGSADIVADQPHGGAKCLRITDRTPHQAYRYVLVNTHWLPVNPETTYEVTFWARGASVSGCSVAAELEGAGEHRQYLPAGTYAWQQVRFRFTVPAGCRRAQVRFLADGLAESLWIDDVAWKRSDVQLANVTEQRATRRWRDWYPRTPGRIAARLCVLDVSRENADVAGMMAALQGIVNRREARLYLINPTNPQRYDEMWLDYLREKGHVAGVERLPSPEAALARFAGETRGAAVWDPALPGSRHAAWMLAGLEDLLPAPPGAAERFGLKVAHDLRGKWRRNVDAYRYVVDRHWQALSHTLLAWEHPESNALSSRDVMVQQRVPMFWVSSPSDGEAGADQVAELEFVEEVLSRTPGNVPVMGWPMYGTRGVEEYTAVRLLSEYGKWVPGTGYNSNGTVLSAVRVPGDRLRQARRAESVPAEPGKVNVALTIMDSGDAHWYWQFHQRRIWGDPARGAVPTGWAMNVTLLDALPPVAQWYYENRTPNDTFLGLIYMNAPVYASRFRKEDRERIWREFVDRLGGCMRRLDMDGVEVYTGGTAGAAASPELLRRFTGGIPGLRYVLAGLGRHAGVQPDAAVQVLDGVPVFQTLTDFRVWTEGTDLTARTMDDENRWLVGEITSHAPKTRPGFMSALAISWIYFPAWIQDLARRLPPEYRLVGPGELARLHKAHTAYPAPVRP